MTRAKTTRKTSTLAKVLISIVVVVAILIVIAEFGLRWYMKSEITSELHDQAVEAGVEEVEDAKVSFGASPVLLGLAQQKIPKLDIDIPSSLNVVYEDNDKSKPVIKGTPKTLMQGKNLQIDLDNDQMVFGELTINTTMSTEVILSALSEADAGDSDDPVAGLISVTDVVPNVEKQTLDVEISNGLATMTMKPEITDGDLAFTMDSIKLLGLELPDALAEAFGDSLSSSADEQLPGGMEADEVRITDEGLEMRLHGFDVDFEDVQSSLDESEGASGSAGNDGSDDGLKGSKNPADHQPGAVGSGGEILNSAA